MGGSFFVVRHGGALTGRWIYFTKNNKKPLKLETYSYILDYRYKYRNLWISCNEEGDQKHVGSNSQELPSVSGFYADRGDGSHEYGR